MKRKKYSHVIITDDLGKPMAWDKENECLCYCTDSDWEDEHFPVQTYTIAKANKYIKEHVFNRQYDNLSPKRYKTSPFEYPVRKRYLFPNKK